MALAILGGVAILVVWAMVAYQQRKLNKMTSAFHAEQTAQANALSAIGNVDLNPSSLTFATIEKTLGPHQQNVKWPGPKQNRTILGWACGAIHCAIYATFLVPSGQVIPPETTLGSLSLIPPADAPAPTMSIGGVHIGETADEVKQLCRQRGFGVETSTPPNLHITWDKDWEIMLGKPNYKVGMLFFVNKLAAKKLENDDRVTPVSLPAQGPTR